MPVDVSTEIQIERPRAEVAAYAADPENATAWYENIEAVRWETPKPVGVGSKIAFVARFLGRQLAYVYEIDEHVPGERFVMSTAQGPFPMETTYTWEDAGEGRTRMVLRNRGGPSGLVHLVAPVLARAIRRANRKDLQRLKSLLEAPVGAGPKPVEAWTEVNLVPVRWLDHALLVELVDPLVHEQLGGEIETWFYLWEPELRLRIRWRQPERADEHRRTLAALLDGWQADGRIEDWYEGSHGARGVTYVGEAEQYGDEAWQSIQRDWMSGSELALELIKLGRSGRLTQTRDYHWARRVHLFTNQLHGPWEAEIELCLRQALGYSKGLDSRPAPEAARLIAELHALLERD